MSYLSRYEAGEHEAVWRELRELGATAGLPELLTDAQDVVAATMRRARSNLERIEAELRAIGYQFEDVPPPMPTAASITEAVLSSGEEALRTLPGLDPAQMVQMLAAVRTQLGQFAAAASAPSSPTPERRPAIGDPVPYTAELKRYEKLAGPAPLSLAGFWRTIGFVDFGGRMPAFGCGGDWRPLAVLPPYRLADDYEEHLADNGSAEGFVVALVPGATAADPLIEVQMPAAADVRLPGGEWFVDYLRRATRAAGHTGPGAPPMPLAHIAEEWEPF